LLSADSYDADLAERYGWINRALPADVLSQFVTAPAHRIAAFPAAGQVAVKERVNAISLAPLEEFRRDSDLLGARVRAPETQELIARAMASGLQTREGELRLAAMLDHLSDGGG
jgi:enoyl-CoA hydratase/carnithine racemase